jgi:TPR repeat protein
MKGLLGFAFIALFPALAAIPPGVAKKPVPGHAEITLYERPSAQRPSFWEAFFKLFRLPNGTKVELPFQRSVAVLVGIGHYQFITPKLEYVSKDVEKMRDYLLGDGGFDAVYVMDEGISPEAVKIFMADEMPQNLKPNDRLLFYYSGHGADLGTGLPVLQFQQARPGQYQNTLRVDEYRQWSGLLKVKHVLFLYDACAAGEATTPKDGTRETRVAVTELSGNGSRYVVTAGTADQEAWVVKKSSDNQYSIFTEALLRVLRDGTAESKGRPFITIGQAVEEAAVILADMTRDLGPGHEMNPYPVKIDRTWTGTFVFLNPHADRPSVPQGDIVAMGMAVPKGAGGADLDKERELAAWKGIETLDDPQLYARFCEDFPDGLFCAVARKRMEKSKAPVSTAIPTQDLTKLSVAELRSRADQGSRDALTQLGKVYESALQGAPMDLQASIRFYKRASDLGDGNASQRIGTIYYFGRKGVPKDQAQAVSWYRKAADAGNGEGMTYLGFMYEKGEGGLPKDDAQAVGWFRKGADAGDATGMSNLGVMYRDGKGGLPKDDAQAVSWLRKAADAGNGAGMARLGFMYENGRGGLAKDEAQAVSWYRKAADAGDGLGMANLGGMYRDGLGGLPKDDTQAVSWYRKAADAGDGLGMTSLGFMYESGRGGLPKDEAQAVSWYRKAAELGDDYAQTALKRLGR